MGTTPEEADIIIIYIYVMELYQMDVFLWK